MPKEEVTASDALASFLRQELKLMNITPTEAARRTGLSQSQMSALSRGSTGVPTPQTLKAIANALLIDYQTLMELAGYLDGIVLSNKSALIRRAMTAMERLPEDVQKMVLRQIEALVYMQHESENER